MSDEAKKLEVAKAIMKHLDISADKLPDYLMDDKSKRNQLTDPDDRVLAHYDEESLFTLRTVRFLKDFSRYKAGIHKETSNKTFLRTAELFRQMGVKNFYFLLQINNPLLANVDPWDENLSDEIKMMVLAECKENVWYLIREVIKIDGRRFRANRAVISFIWTCLSHIPTLILMPRQSGKESRWNTKVLCPDGQWKMIKDIKVGDTIMSHDGTATNVVGHYPQGMKDSYEITFVDGRTANCGAEHLWTVWDAGKGRRGKWRTLDTLGVQERMLELKNNNAKNHLSIPLVKEDKVSKHKDLPVDPYILGVLLGDGSIGDNGISYFKPDDELHKRVMRRLPAGTVMSDRSRPGCKDLIKSPDFDATKHTSMSARLESLKLMGTNTFTKFIPEVYMTGSHAQRTMLLQGLMDTDGTAEKGGNTYYSSSNEQLAKDVQKLAWSLGHICSITARDAPKYTYKGEKLTGKKAYHVNIRSQAPWLLFQDPKRQERVQNCLRGAVFNSKLAIYNVEKLDKQEDSYCIEVDHPDALYVVDDYIVTHNTVGMQVMAFMLQYLIGRNFKGGLITLAASNRMQFVGAMKKIRSGLPEYMINMSYKDKDAGNILTYQGFGESELNTFEVKVPSGGEEGAENIGRGNTFEMLLYDEPAWIKYIENIINGAAPATLTAQRLAREKGVPYFTAQATTPNSILKEEGRFMYNEMMKSTEWRESFFDSYSETHLVRRVMKASPVSTTSPKIAMQFNHLQLGFGHDWVKETMDKLGLSWGKAKIDLLMMWTEEGMNKLFDDKTREKLNEAKTEPLRNQEIKDTGLFVDWFVSEEQILSWSVDPDEYFLIGVDTSDAMSKDACTMVIRRMKTGENIAVGRYPLAFLDDVTVVLKEMMLLIPNSLLIIERNRAMQIIEQLLLSLPSLGIDPFKRIFNYVYQDPIKYKNEYRDVQEVSFRFRTKEFYLRHKAKFGFYTGTASRKEMYGTIMEAVNNTGSRVRYPRLIDELIGLETDANDRIDHGADSHDDLVIAWLLSYWFIKYGYNKMLYGIPQGHTMTQMEGLMEVTGEKQVSKDELELCIRIKDRIEELTRELEGCANEMIAKRIESEMRKLSEFIPKELRKLVTVDEIINSANTERSKRAMNRRFGRTG